MRPNKKSVYWLVFVGVALLAHLLVFLLVRPGFFNVFDKQVSVTEGAASGAVMPDAIITIPIDITEVSEATVRMLEDESTEEPLEEPPEEPTGPHRPRGSATSGVPAIETILDQSPATLPQTRGSEAVAIPPRPIQITWPNTENLEHCLGHYISVRILVGANGDILEVEAQKRDHPEDCIEAAVRSARHIVFEPGRIDGAPAEMWTQVRIDFKRSR